MSNGKELTKGQLLDLLGTLSMEAASSGAGIAGLEFDLAKMAAVYNVAREPSPIPVARVLPSKKKRWWRR